MLTAVRITNNEQVEDLRQMRNACRGTYTNDNSYITKGMQRVFWKKNKDNIVGFLYYNDSDLIGFGILKKIDSKYYSSVGVHPLAQGHGYGKELTHMLINSIPDDVWGVALDDNIGGIKMHTKEDWEFVSDDGKITTFHTLKGRK
jgi:GNAT superfamily N-acetyltransferase